MVQARNFTETKVWQRCVGAPLEPWFAGGSVDSTKFADRVRSHFLAVDEAKYATTQTGSSEEGELLCDTLFSLAYGALLLLSHTRLRLFRGRRYGILGTNGSGKSTLMRQLRDGKVENFPPQDQLRCVMVEHSLQGEDTSLSILDFVASGKHSIQQTSVFAVGRSMSSVSAKQTRPWPVCPDRRSGISSLRSASMMSDRLITSAVSPVDGR